MYNFLWTMVSLLTMIKLESALIATFNSEILLANLAAYFLYPAYLAALSAASAFYSL